MPRDPVTKGYIDYSIVYRSFAQYTKNHKLNHVIDTVNIHLLSFLKSSGTKLTML
jgi:hypothetical protein